MSASKDRESGSCFAQKRETIFNYSWLMQMPFATAHSGSKVQATMRRGERTMLKLATKNLTFEISEDGSDARFVMPANSVKGGDFWRLILDDGLRTEIPVFSHKQKGTVTLRDDVLTIVYERLISEYGDRYDVQLTVVVEKKGELLSFTPIVENRSDVRVNECFCPLMCFDGIAGEKHKDALYMPFGLGQRVEDPYARLESKTKAYYEHNEYETFWHLHYPQASMCWMGIESGDKFLYISRQDPKIRCCFLTVRHTIHTDDLMLGIVHLPMARKGETITFAPTVVGLLDGDFREGAKDYRAFTERSFYRPVAKAEWVQEMTGFQRVIMRSQYGEDYYTADDLPSMYEAGKKYGIDTLFLFAWWKEGMDKNYPEYNEPYEGAYRKLAENIRKVQEMGGRVILEMNCHFIDPQTEYFKKYADEVTVKDIYGNHVHRAFVYPGFGEFNAFYGARTFSVCCSGTQRWRDQLMKQLELLNSFGADCLFADCYGAAPTQPCFDARHEHGNHIDEEWTGRRKFFQNAVAYCEKEDKVLGAEIATDIAASYAQFLHGLFNIDLDPDSEQFPEMFRYTFPEVITTSRGIRCPEGSFEQQLKLSVLYGLRFDAELYTCRACLDKDEACAKVIGECTSFMKRYEEYLLKGQFTVEDRSVLPAGIRRAEYLSADKTKKLKVLYNTTKTDAVVDGVTLHANEFRFTEFN